MRLVAEALRERPRTWAVIKVYPELKGSGARVLALAVRTGRYKAFRPPGTFEARSAIENKTDDRGNTVTDDRGNPVREVNVYARYVGDGS